ncbi:transposase [Botryobacter ruber]|uniref:transposase n=1 Tax=Botryobacter ruber TaxID=2171629 RepID=UPI000E0BCA6F|nr:transposase [Botryobacter ruber]
MEKKYNPQVHHRRSIRLRGYDYSQAGLYFITICTHERGCLFGEIIMQDMQYVMILNDAGKIAQEYWLQIPNHFPNTILHEYIIMPNHVHGIIELTTVGVQNFEPLHETRQNQFQKIIPRSIGSIVRGYKTGVTKWFRTTRSEDFPSQRAVWQRNFYEHIIRNEKSHQTISEYIIDNPAEWPDDKFYVA